MSDDAPAAPKRKRPAVFYTPVHDRNINSVKLLVNTVLPVRYSEDFYKKLIATPYDFTKMGALGLPEAAAAAAEAETLIAMLPRAATRYAARAPLAAPRAAYFDDIFVGCIGGRVEGEGAAKKLYILVLAVLAPYRGRGVGSELLGAALEAAAKQPEIKEVYLHVWTANEDALRFYRRHGFEVAETLKGYYRGISPPDCHILRKAINNGGSGPAATAAAPSRPA
jgi:ribosomal protein S18 acetylase RimI-like enzyme